MMPDTQDPPVKKNIFVLSDTDIKQAAPKVPVAKEQPKQNQFVLSEADTQGVKKKDGTTESSPTPSASSSALPSTAPINEGPKLSELYGQTFDILDKSIPKSNDPAVNSKRQALLESVQKGDQTAIKTARDYISTGINNQIKKIQSASVIDSTPSLGPGMGGSVSVTLSDDQKQQIKNLETQRSSIENTLNQYAANSAANDKGMQAKIRAEVSGTNPKLPNIAFEDLGKTVENIYGGLQNPNGNIRYERQRAGLALAIDNGYMRINDLEALGKKTNNPALIQQADQLRKDVTAMQGKYSNLLDQFPDVATTKVSRLIGDENAEEHPLKPWISKQDVLESARRIESKNPGFMAKYGKYVNVVAESEGSGIAALNPFRGVVPKGGLTGGLEAGAKNAYLDFRQFTSSGAELLDRAIGNQSGIAHDKKTQEEIAAGKADPSLTGTLTNQPSNVVYDKEGKALLEKKNEDYGKINWNSSTFFIGKSIPNLASWILPETAGSKVAMGLGASKGVAKAIGLVAASAYTGWDGDRQLADQQIDDNSSIGTAKKNVLAAGYTLLRAGLFHMIGYSPTKYVSDAFNKSVSTDLFDMYESHGYAPTKKAWQEFITDKALPKAKIFMSELGKSFGMGAKIAAAGTTEQAVKNLVSTVLVPGKVNMTTADEMGKEFVQQTLFMGALGSGFGVKPIMEGFSKTPSTPDALYELGLRAPQYIEAINNKLASGEYTQDQANKAISMTKTMEEEVNKVQRDSNDMGLKLTVQQKVQIAAENFRKRAAQGMKESGVDISAEKINHDADDQIKNIKSQSTHLSLEETQAFKTAVEVDKEGNEVGKPKEVNDINPDSKYKYSKNGRETTTSGLELRAHLPQSSEYVEPGKTGDIELKNEGNADTPTEKNVRDRTNINHPFIKKVSEGLIKLGALKPGEVLSTGVIQGLGKDGNDGFISSVVGFNGKEVGDSVGDLIFRKDGSVSLAGFGDNASATFDKNGNITSYDKPEKLVRTKSVVQKDIDSATERKTSLEKIRGSDNFKYKESVSADPLGRKTKSRGLKTEAELKESTGKINKAIAKIDQEIEGHKKELKNAPDDKTEVPKSKEAPLKNAKIPEGKSSEDPLQKGKDAIELAGVEGKLSDIQSKNAKENPDQFLKDVADQAFGYTREGEKRVSSDRPDAEKSAREQFGDEVVDAAMELHPLDEKTIEDNRQREIKQAGKPKAEMDFIDKEKLNEKQKKYQDDLKEEFSDLKELIDCIG